MFWFGFNRGIALPPATPDPTPSLILTLLVLQLLGQQWSYSVNQELAPSALHDSRGRLMCRRGHRKTIWGGPKWRHISPPIWQGPYSMLPILAQALFNNEASIPASPTDTAAHSEAQFSSKRGGGPGKNNAKYAGSMSEDKLTEWLLWRYDKRPRSMQLWGHSCHCVGENTQWSLIPSDFD